MDRKILHNIGTLCIEKRVIDMSAKDVHYVHLYIIYICKMVMAAAVSKTM